jgi:NADH-quinone oxidoreductase subunit L
MSQIGYMIMGVSSAAYAAGLFHLMTHAFFKALLFMAAGSVIAAMASNQDLDKMGGFRKSMPFTYGCMLIGGLALSGVPPFAGLWSKDEIISLQFERGGWHSALGVLAYVGSFMTAVYTFRMIFRAFHGEPCEEAKELEAGHLAHHDTPTNPATGEVEDYEVGFPGEHHHIAEREGSMQIAMSVLAIGAIGLGFLQIPGVTHVIHTFLEPTFADSQLYATLEPSDSSSWIGLLVGAVIGLGGIALAYRLWVVDTAMPAKIQARLQPLHTFFVNKWYFDELIDYAIVRPFAWFGRFARNTFERLIVDGVLVGGSTGVIKAGSAAVRALQSGFLRAYAALLVLGLTGVGLYFLISAS